MVYVKSWMGVPCPQTCSCSGETVLRVLVRSLSVSVVMEAHGFLDRTILRLWGRINMAGANNCNNNPLSRENVMWS